MSYPPSFIFSDTSVCTAACTFQTVRNMTICVTNGSRFSPAWFLYFPQLTHLTLKFTSRQSHHANSIYHLIPLQKYHEQYSVPYLPALKLPMLHTLHVEISPPVWDKRSNIDHEAEFISSLMDFIHYRDDCHLPLKVVTYKDERRYTYKELL